MHFRKVNPLSFLVCSATNTVSSLFFVVIDVSTKWVVFSDKEEVGCKDFTEDTLRGSKGQDNEEHWRGCIIPECSKTISFHHTCRE